MDQTSRISIGPAATRMRARFNNGVLADSDRALVLREDGRPERFYFPPGDVEQGYLGPSALTTTCSLKGEARYFTARYDGEVAEDAVWTYPQPRAEVSQIAGYLAFDESKGFEVYAVTEGETGHSLTDEERR